MDQRFALLGALLSGSALFVVLVASGGEPFAAGLSVVAVAVVSLIFSRSG
jgi:hypothetical protein